VTSLRPYEPNPRYSPIGAQVVIGWEEAVATLPDRGVLAIDGPAILDWAALRVSLLAALTAAGRLVAAVVDAGEALVAWPEIEARTPSPGLPDDPDFATLSTASLRDLFAEPPRVRRPAAGVAVVFGPGAAFADPDVLWFADLPKRYAEEAIGAGTARNLGQREGDGTGTTRRLFYLDWPVLDRHRDAIAARIDRWIDARQPDRPTSLDGPALRRTIADLARRPFRTRPTFNTVSWGGQWGRRVLGLNDERRNSGVGYELIAPESGVLVGEEDVDVEIPFQLFVEQCPADLLGADVHRRFGTSFPVRFDYLDTVDGGSLSVHCHPQSGYMARVFGWPYTQHETYYLMVGGDGSHVFLGLQDGIDVDDFERQARVASEKGRPFDVERFVQTFPAIAHQLFAIPAGTPHGSGEGNVVLEVSATPYLYSLRFYDWLRRDDAGRQRPVHIDHAFANLARQRTGARVADELVRSPTELRRGNGWREEALCTLPELFFEVRRLELEPGATLPDDTSGRFHVLNVVEGTGVVLETASGDRHDLAYAETLVIPAAVGGYEVRTMGGARVKVVKALVREPPTMLIPALEVGGTHVTAAVVDLSAGRVLEPTRSRRPLNANGPATDIIGTLVEAAAPVAAAAGRNAPLGVAIPGPFDYARGIGRFEGVAKFESLVGVDVGTALRAGLDRMVGRIAFLNDADAFVLGEWAWGAAAGHGRVVGITLGTGVGSGFLDDGRVVADGPLVPPDGSVHLLAIGGRPLEEAVSRRALLRQARLAIEELPADADVLDVAILARAGDQRARRVFDDAFAVLGSALALWLARFEASVLVVGGSIAGSWDLVRPPLVDALRRAEPALSGLVVRRAAHPEDSALIGAAVHASAVDEAPSAGG
jgi:predicted NBD/HSP70 family sugar kinase